jgi:hypothetical protein
LAHTKGYIFFSFSLLNKLVYKDLNRLDLGTHLPTNNTTSHARTH